MAARGENIVACDVDGLHHRNSDGIGDWAMAVVGDKPIDAIIAANARMDREMAPVVERMT